MKQAIELQIEELVLHGFSPYHRYQIASAVEAELGRLFKEQGVPTSLNNSINVPSLNAGFFEMGSNTKANATGNKIAGSIYKSFRK